MFVQEYAMSSEKNPPSFEGVTTTPQHFVYPRLKSFIKSTSTRQIKQFAEAAGLSPNTVSPLFSGKPVSDDTIAACQIAANNISTPHSGKFKFSEEQMLAEGHFIVEDINKFVNNRALPVVAEILGIPAYLMVWIAKGHPISITKKNEILKRFDDANK